MPQHTHISDFLPPPHIWVPLACPIALAPEVGNAGEGIEVYASPPWPSYGPYIRVTIRVWVGARVRAWMRARFIT